MNQMTFFEDTDRMVAGVVGVPGFPATQVVNPDGTLGTGWNGMLSLDVLTQILDDMGVERVAAE